MDERVTVTLPSELVRDIDRFEKDRSRFLQEAARAELERRRRGRLRRSLESPHPETVDSAGTSDADWASTLPDEDAAGLVDMQVGRDVRWVPGEGWTDG
jgi:hypothetical protein